jgi:hypothetical protein
MGSDIIYIIIVFIILLIILKIIDYINQYSEYIKQINNDRKIIISLTTTPKRLNECINNLMIMINSNVFPKNSEIHLNLPKIFKRTGEIYQKITSPHEMIKIFDNIEDEGPATKILPTLDRFQNSDVLIISIDDDILYNDEIFNYHLYMNKEYDNKVVTTYSDLNYYFNSKVSEIKNKFKENVSKIKLKNINLPHHQGYFIEGYSSVAYPTSIVKADMIRTSLNKCKNSDDLIISKELCNNNIPIIVIGNSLYKFVILNLMIKSQDFGLKEDALHKMQNHIDKYFECL